MQIKYTEGTLSKLEKIFSEVKYVVRYEKGTFNSGYCVLEHKKVVVVNKFLNIEGRINALADILPALDIDVEELPEDLARLYRQLLQQQKKSVLDKIADSGEEDQDKQDKGKNKPTEN